MLPLQTVLHCRERTSLVSIHSFHRNQLAVHHGQLANTEIVGSSQELRSVIIYVCHPEKKYLVEL